MPVHLGLSYEQASYRTGIVQFLMQRDICNEPLIMRLVRAPEGVQSYQEIKN